MIITVFSIRFFEDLWTTIDKLMDGKFELSPECELTLGLN